MPTRSTTRCAIISAVTIMLALSGCSAVAEPSAPTEPAAATEPEAPAKPAKPECTEISDSLLATINDLVVAKGRGETVVAGGALMDEKSGWWHVAGHIDIVDPASDDVFGVWATQGDPAAEPFVGKIFSVNDNAAPDHSVAEMTNEANIDPERMPMLSCVPKVKG